MPCAETKKTFFEGVYVLQDGTRVPSSFQAVDYADARQQADYNVENDDDIRNFIFDSEL